MEMRFSTVIRENFFIKPKMRKSNLFIFEYANRYYINIKLDINDDD